MDEKILKIRLKSFHEESDDEIFDDDIFMNDDEPSIKMIGDIYEVEVDVIKEIGKLFMMTPFGRNQLSNMKKRL